MKRNLSSRVPGLASAGFYINLSQRYHEARPGRAGACPGRDAWTITQAGRTLSSATAAERITRATAEKALQQFLGRVERVNNDPHFLGKVTRLVLFGSMLKPEVERLSDVDLAVELASKEPDFDRARVKNYERVEELATQGHRFRNFLEREGCWYWEIFRFLKGQSRVIALADYSVEKTFVLTVR